jgi:hypothetical protein
MPSAEARPSGAEKGGSGVSPDYDTAQHAHAQKKAEHSDQAERSNEGWFGGLARPRQRNSHATRRRPSRAQRPGRAQREKRSGGFPRLRHLNSPMRQRSQAQRPRRALPLEQQQPTRSKSKNKRRETSRLQEKGMLALLCFFLGSGRQCGAREKKNRFC